MATGYLEKIRQIYRREQEKKDGKPLNALWEWAMEPDGAGERARRFEALSNWARKKERAADDKEDRKDWEAATEAYRKKYRFFKDKADKPPDKDGIGTFDGKLVAAWIIPWLEKSRKAGWNGYLVSGYRTPEYSEQLCYAMCGRPTCPGRCAGRYSNHAKHVYPEGAIDVSDYTRFGQIQKQIGSPLFNALGPADPVHFSTSGR